MKMQGYKPVSLTVRETDWYGLLNQEEKEFLTNSSSRVEYKAGETVVKQGFSASHILFLEKGVVKLNVENRGKVTTFKIVNEGNFIGIMCSFVNKKLDFYGSCRHRGVGIPDGAGGNGEVYQGKRSLCIVYS